MEWADVINNPLLKNLPFKIELNKWGKILMSPASNLHGRIQGYLTAKVLGKLNSGEVITECSIDTSGGVKVADIAWLSDEFIAEFKYSTPYPKAPEICVEIVSPSNSKIEIQDKVDLYLAEGAVEVWIVYDLKNIEYYTHIGPVKVSKYVVY